MIGICIFYVVISAILSFGLAIYYDSPMLSLWAFILFIAVIAIIILLLYILL